MGVARVSASGLPPPPWGVGGSGGAAVSCVVGVVWEAGSPVPPAQCVLGLGGARLALEQREACAAGVVRAAAVRGRRISGRVRRPAVAGADPCPRGVVGFRPLWSERAREERGEGEASGRSGDGRCCAVRSRARVQRQRCWGKGVAPQSPAGARRRGGFGRPCRRRAPALLVWACGRRPAWAGWPTAVA